MRIIWLETDSEFHMRSTFDRLEEEVVQREMNDELEYKITHTYVDWREFRL